VTPEIAQLIAALAVAAGFAAYADVIFDVCKRIARATRMFPDAAISSKVLGWTRRRWMRDIAVERNSSNVIHIEFVRQGPRSERTRSFQGVALLVSATASLAVSAGALCMLVLHSSSEGQVFTTGADEFATKQLPDGSTLFLGTRSRAVVRVSDQQCVTEFVKGEGKFEVARYSPKTFVVETFLATATAAAGASFRVAIDSSVEFELYEGTVQVVAEGKNASAAVVTLKKGVPYRVRRNVDTMVARIGPAATSAIIINEPPS
jgi:ferric-dicitrate binding protein FerR (iron transport regulator)